MPEKKKIDPVPTHFATYDEAAEFWERHDTTDYPEIFRTVEEGSRGGHKRLWRNPSVRGIAHDRNRPTGDGDKRTGRHKRKKTS